MLLGSRHEESKLLEELSDANKAGANQERVLKAMSHLLHQRLAIHKMQTLRFTCILPVLVFHMCPSFYLCLYFLGHFKMQTLYLPHEK